MADFSAEALSALVNASAAITSAQGLAPTLDAIAGAAVVVMNAEASSVILLDTERRRQVFRAAHGGPGAHLIGVEYDDGLGVSGKVLRTGRAEIVHDVNQETTHYREIDALTPEDFGVLLDGTPAAARGLSVPTMRREDETRTCGLGVPRSPSC